MFAFGNFLIIFKALFYCSTKFVVKDLNVSGLSTLKLDAMEYNPDCKEFKILLTPPKLHVKTNYSLDTEIDFIGKLKISHTDEGYVDADFQLPGKEMGVSFEFSTNEVTGNLTTKNWKLHHEEINLEEKAKRYSYSEKDEILPILKKIQENVSDFITKTLKDGIDKIVGDFKDVHQVTEFLNKASVVFDEEQCVNEV